MIIALIIAILFALMLLYTVLKQNKQVKRMKEEVEAYKNVAECSQHIIEGYRSRAAEEEAKYIIIHAEYCTSDSDLIKYSSQKAMENAIRSKLAMLIGNDILKRFEMNILPIGEGKEKYSLVLKLKKI